MGRCGLLIGMRFHSLVLSSAAGAAILGLVYAPKVRGYMRLLECEEFSVELKNIEDAAFPETIVNAWTKRDELKTKQQAIVDGLRAGARYAGTQLRELYFPELNAPQSADSRQSNPDLHRDAKRAPQQQINS